MAGQTLGNATSSSDGALRARLAMRRIVLAAAVIDVLFKILLTPAYMSAVEGTPSGRQVLVSLARCGIPVVLMWVGAVVLLLLPVTAWLRADAAGEGRSRIATAGQRIYRLPLLLGAVWSLQWLVFVWVLVPDLGAFRWPTFLCLAATAAIGPMPIGHMVMGRLLWAAVAHVSERAREEGVRLATVPLSLRSQMVLFGFCVALAPSSYMAEVAFAAGAGDLTFRGLVWLTLAFCVAIAAFTIICAVAFASAIATPLVRMSTIIHTITQQGVVTRVGRLPQLQRDEVGELAEATNAMIDRLEQSETRRAAINASLEHLNRTLEERVSERTESLSRANQALAAQRDALEQALVTLRASEEQAAAMRRQLLDMSRKAGAAEVAVNVLHSVGNVLNSATVSSNVLHEAVHSQKVNGLSRLAALLRDQDDLPRFFAEDPRAAKIPDFLAQLGKALEAERSEMATELHTLQTSLERVMDIVDRQQALASAGIVVEEVQLADLLEHALALSRARLERESVTVARDYDDLPPMALDRHRILQIVTQLLANAVEAVFRSTGDRQIGLRLRRAAGWISIEVADTGAGIEAQNLLRIFNDGFTTKHLGHGAGLHESACAAAAMGGSLSAHSDGEGQGASFTLRLPVPPRREVTGVRPAFGRPAGPPS
jgi:signal transduction histidine kinase